MKDDIHRLRDADTIDILDQAQGNKRCAAAIIDQERDTSTMKHPCSIEHIWGPLSDNTFGHVYTKPPTLVDDHFRDRNGLHSALPFFTVIGADVDKFDSLGDVVAETLFVTGAIGNEGVQDELFYMSRDIALYL